MTFYIDIIEDRILIDPAVKSFMMGDIVAVSVDGRKYFRGDKSRNL